MSKRRCAFCFGLERDLAQKDGQIAHIDRDHSNPEFDNLAFLCLEHHNQYDSKTSQSKGLASRELKAYQLRLFEFNEKEGPHESDLSRNTQKAEKHFGLRVLGVGLAAVTVVVLLLSLTWPFGSAPESKSSSQEAEAEREFSPKAQERWKSAVGAARDFGKKVELGSDIGPDAPTPLIDAKLEELAALYNYRANLVRDELSDLIEYAPAEEYLKSFDSLHAQHIAAIQSGHLVLAAEILRRIHTMSRDLDSAEFWITHQIESPNVDYSLCLDAFARGDLIELYVGRRLTEALVLESGMPVECQDFEVSRDDIDWHAVPRVFYDELRPRHRNG